MRDFYAGIEYQSVSAVSISYMAVSAESQGIDRLHLRSLVCRIESKEHSYTAREEHGYQDYGHGQAEAYVADYVDDLDRQSREHDPDQTPNDT